LNLIVLTAALSVYNSCVYSNSRMLYGLARQGNAPAFLSKLNHNHVPVKAILVSGLFAAICIVVNKVIPEKALEVLMSLVVSTLIINWLMISVVHLKFKQHKTAENIHTKFPSFIYPVSNYICLIFLVGILVLMWITGMKLPVALIPGWVIFLYLCYLLVKRNSRQG
jgi:aromatic amino acid transport protein AroP